MAHLLAYHLIEDRLIVEPRLGPHILHPHRPAAHESTSRAGGPQEEHARVEAGVGAALAPPVRRQVQTVGREHHIGVGELYAIQQGARRQTEEDHIRIADPHADQRERLHQSCEEACLVGAHLLELIVVLANVPRRRATSGTAEADGRHARCEARAVQAVVQRAYEQLGRSKISERRHPIRDERRQCARAESEEQRLRRREH